MSQSNFKGPYKKKDVLKEAAKKEEEESGRERFEDVILPALKMED